MSGKNVMLAGNFGRWLLLKGVAAAQPGGMADGVASTISDSTDRVVQTERLPAQQIGKLHAPKIAIAASPLKP